ncbi:MAG TPA: tetratricopeptide repeat protein [Pyrinomonadaceae bacterium]|nr:tetratricopeptide repeat protein [Pyrinomonadaceae bacterium]
MNRSPLRICVSVILLVISFGLAGADSARAKDNWTKINSKHFTLIGSASEKDIRQVANRLEQFRAVFGSLFPNIPLNSSVPTVVIVFKNDVAFRPYKANPEEAGYFQPGEDINYIALTAERASQAQPFRIMFHEYVHLLVNNSMGASVPLWFNEGLAEYYSTFDITSDERRIVLGNLIGSHVLSLRRNEFLPLRTLFAVDYKSPYYNEANQMNIFYAESWMFMHYLLQSDGQKHRSQLNRFVELLRAGVRADEAFPQAFQNSVEAVERDFRNYLQASKFVTEDVTFERKLDYGSELRATAISEADAHACLGDLLAHTNRFPEAEVELQQALQLNAESLPAHTALGLMRVRQGRMDDARLHLEKAIKGQPENYLLHYYYAYALSGLNLYEHRLVANYSAAAAAAMRQELDQVIALKPDYAGSYWLLGFVNLVRNEQIDESIDVLKQGAAVTSGNHRVLFMLAQLYMRKERFAEARQLLTPIAQTSTDADLRNQAALFANAITRAEEQRAEIRQKLKEDGPVGIADRSNVAPVAPTQEDPNAALAEALRTPRAGEQRVQGLLTAIDCNTKGVTFQVREGSRLWKFHSDNFERMSIATFTTGVGREIGCGPRKPENLVVLTFTPAPAAAKSDGEAKALEFVPQAFLLKP